MSDRTKRGGRAAVTRSMTVKTGISVLSGLVCMVCASAGLAASAGGDGGFSSVKVGFMRKAAEHVPFAAKAEELLRRGLQERGCKLTDSGSDTGNVCEVVLDVRPGIGTEGFRIFREKGAVRISGNDGRGLIYGVGKFLRGCTFTDTPPEGFRPSEWQGVSIPKRAVRGMYFATHFHNFYHDAPIEKVERYIDDLALWGCNTLDVWFDMHHYNGIHDPAAQEMIGRLHRILKAANGVGMDGGLTFLANEGYADSPAALRADWTAGHDGYQRQLEGHYHVEICPNRPGGLDLILKERREVLRAFSDLDIAYVTVWPYDQGGCTCAKCAPWGGNGFVKTAAACAALAREEMPRAKVILATWLFDVFVKGDWEGLDASFKTGPVFADYLLANGGGDTFPEYPLKHGVPGGLPLVDFPEISMYRMSPWGGYGANPLPDHLQRIWRESGSRLAGGFPYSEGIFEDLDKAICLQFYWGDVDARKTVAEYASGIASPELAEKLSDAIYRLEEQHGDRELADVRDWTQALPPESAVPVFRIDAKKLVGADETLKRFEEIEARLPSEARTGWRWRLLFLRAGIDAELARQGGKMTEKLDNLLSEITTIMSLEHAQLEVRPQNVAAIRERLKK